jgi:1-phosphatidylinositol-4-phosphate 5-kinase
MCCDRKGRLVGGGCVDNSCHSSLDWSASASHAHPLPPSFFTSPFLLVSLFLSYFFKNLEHSARREPRQLRQPSSAFFFFFGALCDSAHQSPPMTSFVAAIRPPAPLPSPPDHSSQLSSAASFHTAPSTFNSFSPKPPSSRSSSGFTYGPADIQCSSANPIHIVAPASEDAPQELHIIKVTDEAVHMQSTSSSGSIVHKVAEPFLHVVARGEVRECSVGPPPPSPPASDGHPDEDQIQIQGHGSTPPVPPSKSEPVSTPSAYRPPRLSASSSYNSSLAGPGPSTLSRRFRADESPILAPIVPSRRLPPLSTDGLLQPSLSSMRSPRRNTIGSTPRSPRTTPRGANHLNITSEDRELSEELVSDIQQQAEQIRRERLSKRVKQVEEAPRVLVGNLIGEGHDNYVLMYNMLTGIRIAVSRTQAKIKRTLTDDDFTARHKYSFDM